ncbi:2-hydroxymuconic semialdehyde hydrolase [hydrothermal vent metagenome]|uniref:Palmitoyl-protein thioesterase ABHD10, mitochondrial n=1 Tax=hydrothermal vent metagenome TaxID=652676 RepID=A0A3B0RXP2_9ZZZZ
MDKLEHKTANGQIICYAKVDGAGPSIVWLGGFRSDMCGTKAEFVHQLAVEKGLSFVRFDYFGHGSSSGEFADGSISQWRNDVLQVIDKLTQGPLILLGSSMGGWLALLAALARPERVKALVLVAPAPDFTRALLWEQLDAQAQQQIMQSGCWMQPSAYGPVPITRKLIEDGDQHILLDKPISFFGPVRILQGQADTDVPWQHALQLTQVLRSQDVVFTLSKSGDHSLSQPDDLLRLQNSLLEMLQSVQENNPKPI